jgi:UDP-hydrolysing UDP-N-acetyl-D-glucosamine 2-epimerase
MVTGMHLSVEHGRTIDLIKKDGFKIDFKIDMDSGGGGQGSMALSAGKGIIGMAKAFMRKRPDIVVVLGDRVEALACTVAAVYMNIPVAHIHGGDISSGLDEYVRHAITKMSNLHFVASKRSMERVIGLGEDPQHVYLTGAPALDTIMRSRLFSKKELERKYGLDLGDPYILLLQHPVTTQRRSARKQMASTLEAVRSLRMRTIIVYPNSDTGGKATISEIEKMRGLPFVNIFKNIPYLEYLSLQKHASVLIGNSSGGIIESPLLGIPVVNIGTRQEGRERSQNVIDARHDKDSIISAVRKAIYDKKFRSCLRACRNPYGDGHAGERIAHTLANVKVDDRLMHKKLVFKKGIAR